MMDSITDTCCLSRRERESIDHLFIHCSLTSSIWGHFLNLCGVGEGSSVCFWLDD